MRILMLVYGTLGKRVSGPEIRGLALARELARHHEVTVAIGDGSGEVGAGIRVVSSRRRALAWETLRHDVFFAAAIPPYVLALRLLRPFLAVTDQYDPVELEMALHDGAARERSMRAARAARRLQLSYADVVLCANDAQRELLVTELDGLGRRTEGPAVEVVSFGIPPAPKRSGHSPLRERFPQIQASDRVVLWWGSVWKWLDAETAIRAVAGLDGVRLVITAGRPPSGNPDGLTAMEEAADVAATLGLLGDKVLLLDEWIPYEQRHHYLMDADVGITLHRDTAEAAVAARSRYMDYLWAGLPCVLARGDELAERFAKAGFAELVPPHDTDAVAATLARTLADRDGLRQMRTAGAGLATTLGWDKSASALTEVLEAARHPRPFAPVPALSLIGGVGAEYLRLGLDALAA
jgi:glycosyltransferase involved in cell wall biosynthesis